MCLQMNSHELPTTVNRLVPELTGPANEAITTTQVKLKTYATKDGVYEFLRWLIKSVGIDHAGEEKELFEAYFSTIRRQKTKA